MTGRRHLYIAKLRLISSLTWLSANARVLIMILSNFLLPVLVDGKRGGNRGGFGKKTSFKAVFLILPLHNSFKDALLLFSLYLLIILSSFCIPVTKSGIDVFGKNNSGIAADNPGIVADNLSTAADNSGTATNNPSKAADNPGIVADNLGTKTDANVGVDNPGIAADNPGIEINIDAGVDNSGTVKDNLGTGTNVDAGADNLDTAASNKACARATSFFALCYDFFLLASFSKSMTVFLPSFSTTLR